MQAIVLLSGGLDSRLAVALMLRQNIEVHGLHFTSVFAPGTCGSEDLGEARRAADDFGIPLTVEDITDDLIELVKDAPHGLGSGMNPCIDCRIMQLRRARELMPEVGAKFLVTGEVLGQRPMSQRKGAMGVIERAAGVEGLVVRPLCAQVMEPTIPEKEGWVDREKLKGFTGRHRKPQMDLAEELGITDYPNPAGGCRLTEPGFARRVEDLRDNGELSRKNVLLLEVGRHFRLSVAAKLVVGREHDENLRIEELAGENDYLLVARNYPGPTTLGRGEFDEDLLQVAARITARYGKGKTEPEVLVDVCRARTAEMLLPPAEDAELEKSRL